MDLQAAVQGACKTAEAFVKHYYATFDSALNRANLAALYAPGAVLVWNGNAVSGLEAVVNSVCCLPASKHAVETFDVQPCALEANSLMVVVTGKVRYGEDAQRPFSQTFFLQPTGGQPEFHIHNDRFRFA